MKGNYLFYLVETREDLLRAGVQIEWLQMTSLIATDVFQLFLYKRCGDINIYRIGLLLERSSGGITTSLLCKRYTTPGRLKLSHIAGELH
jgi:hypothetical protein